MITDLSVLSAIQSEWHGVVLMRERVRHLVVATFAYDSTQSPTFGDVLYNLPLILAFDVLTAVLIHAKDQGLFTSSGTQLDELMDGAKSSLPWLDWQYLRDGVQRRNEVARSARLFGDLQCLLYIARIEDQLTAWNIVSPALASTPVRTASSSARFQK